MKRGVLALFIFAGLLTLGFGQDIVHKNENLTSSDEKYNSKTPIHWYQVSLKAGNRLAIRAVSVDFTPEIVVSTGIGEDQIKSGTGGSAAYSYSSDADVTLRIGVTPASADVTTGTFTVKISQVLPQPALKVGERRSGVLAYDDETMEDDRSVEWFPVAVTKGQRLAVALWSQDFSPSIVGTLPDGSDIQTEQAASGHSIARFVVNQSGELRIGVTSDSKDEGGSFTLQVVVPPVARSVSVGQTIRGNLRDGDDMLAGQPMDAYRVTGKANDIIDVKVDSTVFDPFVFISDDKGDIEKNDDISSDNTNSEIQHTFASDGEVEIRIYAVDSTSRGAYELSVEPGTPSDSMREGNLAHGALAGDAVPGIAPDALALAH